MLVLQSHYQTESDFSFAALDSAKTRLHNWRNMAAMRWQVYGAKTDEDSSPSLATKKIILDAINQNLDTPKALSKIDEIFTDILNTPNDKISAKNLNELIVFIDDLLGLDLINFTPDINDEIKQKILERRTARNEKDWAKSDEVRDELLEQGIRLRDSKDKTFWEYN